MRLFAITVPVGELELAADRCWQAGAAGIWEVSEAHGSAELRVGVEDGDIEAFLAAVDDLGPGDVTDTEAFELATRTVQVGAGDAAITVQVPPTVFGDGLHPTTATCLELLADLTPASVLDVGCGSGVLSVAAARAGAAVTAIDVDPVAVEATLANAAANGVEVAASTTPIGEVEGTYEVVVANISAEAVVALVDDLRRVCAPGGVIVPSGILAERWGEVADRLDGTISDVHVVDGWVTAVVTP